MPGAGSVASLWQQAGRAGRREQPSVSIYIGFDGPLDQFFMHQPENLFSRSIETAQVQPALTLCCSAKPSPFCVAQTESQESQQRFDTLKLDFLLAHHRNPLGKEVQMSPSWLPMVHGTAAWTGKHAACAEVADYCIRPIVSFRGPGQ